MPTICINNKCNNNCIICTNPDNFLRKQRGLSYEFLLKRLQRFYNGEKEFIDHYTDSFSISGGEPTLSPHLLPLMAKINSLFKKAKIRLLTNGRRFAYFDYAKAVCSLPLNLEFIISLHGHSAKTHDAVTQARGSFNQTVRGLKNIMRFKRPSQALELRVILHGENYTSLKKITGFIKKHFPRVDRLVFVFFEAEGQARKNIERLQLTYAGLLPYLKEAFPLMRSFPDARLYHFPLCVVPKEMYPYVWRTLPEYEVSFLKSCARCQVKENCLGIHSCYLDCAGAGEFIPVKAKVRLRKSGNWHHPINGIEN